MATLEQRIRALEAKRSGLKPDDPQQAAIGQLITALREALPADDLAGAEQLASYRSHMDKILALAERIEAGELSEEDRMLLDWLPQDAALDMTPAEFITLTARIDMLC